MARRGAWRPRRRKAAPAAAEGEAADGGAEGAAGAIRGGVLGQDPCCARRHARAPGGGLGLVGRR